MKNRMNINRIFTLILFLCVVFSAQAQSSRAGYFLKGNPYRYRMNPALSGDQGYFSIPVLGNLNLGVRSNMGLANFIYPKGDNLVTFMHPDVSAEEFLGSLSNNNKLNLELDMTLLSAGFYAFGGYNSIDIALHSHSGLNLPYDLFHFMKDMSKPEYSLENLSAFTRNYVDVAIGHSHKITRDLTIGARLKFLLGLAYADLLMENMSVSVNGDKWMINAKGSASAAFGAQFTSDEDGKVNGLGDFAFGMNSMGFAVDLGATYDFSNVLTKGLVLSASVTDIGYMNWKNVSKAGIMPDEPYVFDGFDEFGIAGNGDGAESGSENATIGDQMEEIGRDLGEFFAVKNQGVGSKHDFLGATLNVGVEYKMPFYKKMSVGALFTSRFAKSASYTKGSLLLNISPIKFFDFAAGASVSTFGYDLMAMLNLHVTGFNLFVAADCYAGRVSKEYIPLDDVNANISFGINIPLGKRR